VYDRKRGAPGQPADIWASWPAVCGEAALRHARTLLCCSWVLYEDPCGLLWPDCCCFDCDSVPDRKARMKARIDYVRDPTAVRITCCCFC
jgi:hypothetical protein